jgi:hypothetical protein
MISKLFACLLLSLLVNVYSQSNNLMNKKTNREYTIPFSLNWNSPKDTVIKAFASKYTFQDSSLKPDGFRVTYTGDYAGFYNCKIYNAFVNDSFNGFGVIIPKQGEFPITKTWFDVLQKITAKYGKADSISTLTTNTELGDKAIQRGEWTPGAFWKFKTALLCAFVQVGKPDENGYSKPEIYWMTINMQVVNKLIKDTKKKVSDEF